MGLDSGIEYNRIRSSPSIAGEYLHTHSFLGSSNRRTQHSDMKSFGNRMSRSHNGRLYSLFSSNHFPESNRVALKKPSPLKV
jgi:hypothetical protein